MGINVQDICRLTPMQEGMLFHALQNSDSDIYFVQNAYFVNKDLHIPYLKKSLDQLFERHESLRSAFVYEKQDTPLRVVLRNRKPEFNYKDTRNDVNSDKEKIFRDFVQAESKRRFDLSSDVLFRLSILQTGDHEFVLVWSHHHILMDGWSTRILMAEFQEIYESLVGARPCVLQRPRLFSDYVKWIDSRSKEDSRDFWKQQLAEYDGGMGVAVLRDIFLEAGGKSFSSHSFQLGDQVLERLKPLASHHRVTFSTIMRVAWGLLIAKYNNCRDVVFGAVVSTRPKEIEGVEEIVGLLINTIPVRIKFDQHTKVSDLLHGASEQSLASEAHQHYSLAAIQAESNLRSKLFDHILTFENYPDKRAGQHGNMKTPDIFEVSEVERKEQNSFDFTVLFFPGQPFEIKINYNTNCFSRDAIEKLSRQFMVILDQLTGEDRSVDDISILLQEDRSNVVERFNTPGSFEIGRSVLDVFQNVVNTFSANIAVKDKERQFTYRELDEVSSRLAYHLTNECHVKCGDLVGIMLDVSSLVMVGMLGILKSGAAFVPIDTGLPVSRKKHIIDDCALAVLLTDSGNIFKLEGYQGQLVALDIQLDSFSALPANFSTGHAPHDVAYVIYTSGSTGVPKGVMIENRSLVNYVSWLTAFSNISDSENTLLMSSYAFDLGYTAIWGTLLNGGTLHLSFQEFTKSAGQILDYLAAEKISLIKVTPSLLNMLIHLPGFNSRELHLRMVIVGGEKFKYEDGRLLLNKYPRTQIINHYGPTECTIGTIANTVNEENLDSYKYQSIVGRPISNSRIFIRDAGGGLSPVGVFGEICVGGEGLARGYVNSPDLTFGRFDESLIAGEKLYRTGDVGRWLKDGTIEIAGRIDSQIKVRGYRVDLKEIEASILKHDLVEDVVVVSASSGKDEHRLAAYVKTVHSLDAHEMTEFLRRHLAHYMIPSHYCFLGSFPLNENGKLDRRRLLKEHVFDAVVASPVKEPENEVQREILLIWRDVLGVVRIGVSDNFFALGGHSLSAVQVVARILKNMNVRLGIDAIFEHPTIEQLAHLVSGQRGHDEAQILPIEEQQFYRASDGQRRIWVSEQFSEDKRLFTIIRATLIEGELNIPALRQAFSNLIQRHEILRTSIITDTEGIPQQRVHPFQETMLSFNEVPLPKGQYCNVDLGKKLMEKEVHDPHQLDQAPLFRVKLFKDANKNCLLILSIHHIITDFRSSEVFRQEVLDVYNAIVENRHKEMSPLRVQYKDFSAWINKQLSSQRIEANISFWKKIFTHGVVPRLNLRTDFPRPDHHVHEGGSHYFNIGHDLTDALKTIAKHKKVTLFAVFLSCIKVLLVKLTHQRQLLVGVPVSQRGEDDLTGQIGFYLELLPVYTEVPDHISFNDLVDRVNAALMASKQHQPLPFDRLVDGLNIPAAPNKNPLIDVGVNFVNAAGGPKKETLKGAKLTDINNTVSSVKTDLWFNAWETQSQIEVKLDFCIRLFKPHTIEAMAVTFLSVIRNISTDPGIALKTLFTGNPVEEGSGSLLKRAGDINIKGLVKL